MARKLLILLTIVWTFSTTGFAAESDSLVAREGFLYKKLKDMGTPHEGFHYWLQYVEDAQQKEIELQPQSRNKAESLKLLESYLNQKVKVTGIITDSVLILNELQPESLPTPAKQSPHKFDVTLIDKTVKCGNLNASGLRARWIRGKIILTLGIATEEKPGELYTYEIRSTDNEITLTLSMKSDATVPQCPGTVVYSLMLGGKRPDNDLDIIVRVKIGEKLLEDKVTLMLTL